MEDVEDAGGFENPKTLRRNKWTQQKADKLKHQSSERRAKSAEAAVSQKEELRKLQEANQSLRQQLQQKDEELLRAQAQEAAAVARAEAAEGQVGELCRQLVKAQRIAVAISDLKVTAEAECKRRGEALHKIRKECECPISHCLPADAVVAADGHTYDGALLARCVRQWGRSPMTRQRLQEKGIYPNRLASAITAILLQMQTASFAEAAKPEPSKQEASPKALDLLDAISMKDEVAALQLLRLPLELNGLNELDPSDMTTLILAIHNGLPLAAAAILARSDFKNLSNGAGNWTALHEAARQGHLQLCRVIVGVAGVTVLKAKDYRQMTAAQVALEQGHGEVATFLSQS